MTEVAATGTLGESLSPSQVSTYLTCPAKWYFRYLVGLSEPASSALALGKAFYGTLARNFRQKMSTDRDMESGELTEAFNQEWSSAVSEAVLRDGEDAGDLATTGQVLVAAYLAEAAPSVTPGAVEQTVQGEIAGVKVRGIVDLLDKGQWGCPEHSLQLTTYAMITPGVSGLCRLDTVTKTKTGRVVQQSFRSVHRIGALPRRCIPWCRNRSVTASTPHRSSPMCSRRYCGYWRDCEREFGGRIAG